MTAHHREQWHCLSVTESPPEPRLVPAMHTGCSWTSITENDLILPPQIVFGSGDTLRTLTLTANGGFVRAAAHQVLEHRTFFGVVTVYAYREIPHKSLIVGNFLISDVFPLVLGHSHQ